jgi:predicted NBD/HSP70 family sugar kinase
MARQQPRAALPPLLKDLNRRTVLETIRSGAPISRAEISRRAGISKPTVSLALRALLDAGLVREATAEPGGPSYGAVFFEPVPDAALAFGFDLGARFLRGAVCDLGGAVRARQDIELETSEPDALVETIARLRASLAETAGLESARMGGAVVGVPGVVDQSTGRVHLTHFAGLEGRRLGQQLVERLGFAVTLENDVNLAALGEQWQGIARGVDDFVFMSIGTGLGAGLVLRGELHRGSHGAAGELDNALQGVDGDADPCAGAVSAFAARLVAESPEGATVLRPPFDPREIFATARAGDALARRVVDEVARRIALHAAPVAAVADVELVVLGGGLGTNGDLLLEPVRELLARWVPYPPRVEISTLGEAAVLTGALAVALRSALETVVVNGSLGGRGRRSEAAP